MFQAGSPVFLPMTEVDLDEVMAIETLVYPFPWNRQNFMDSLNAGHQGMCLRDAQGSLLGYFMLMPVVDEMHLLNVCVAPACQGNGLGIALLNEIVRLTAAGGMGSILLEVRPSNTRALRIYENFGFHTIGRRKEYYPAHHGRREDAIVMRLTLENSRAVA